MSGSTWRPFGVALAWCVLSCGLAIAGCDASMSGDSDGGGSALDATAGSDGGMCVADMGDCSGGQSCCPGLRCVLNRMCRVDVASDAGASGTDGGASDGGAGSTDGGATSDGGSTSADAGSGTCVEELGDCSVLTCCAGLECRPTDRGPQCRVP
ncbi:MAG: hypothetical protein AB7S26_03360 [Sandaracinaceae bacterium]